MTNKQINISEYRHGAVYIRCLYYNLNRVFYHTRSKVDAELGDGELNTFSVTGANNSGAHYTLKLPFCNERLWERSMTFDHLETSKLRTYSHRANERTHCKNRLGGRCVMMGGCQALPWP